MRRPSFGTCWLLGSAIAAAAFLLWVDAPFWYEASPEQRGGQEVLQLVRAAQHSNGATQQWFAGVAVERAGQRVIEQGRAGELFRTLERLQGCGVQLEPMHIRGVVPGVCWALRSNSLRGIPEGHLVELLHNPGDRGLRLRLRWQAEPSPPLVVTTLFGGDEPHLLDRAPELEIELAPGEYRVLVVSGQSAARLAECSLDAR